MRNLIIILGGLAVSTLVASVVFSSVLFQNEYYNVPALPRVILCAVMWVGVIFVADKHVSGERILDGFSIKNITWESFMSPENHMGRKLFTEYGKWLAVYAIYKYTHYYIGSHSSENYSLFLGWENFEHLISVIIWVYFLIVPIRILLTNGVSDITSNLHVSIAWVMQLVGALAGGFVMFYAFVMAVTENNGGWYSLFIGGAVGLFIMFVSRVGFVESQVAGKFNKDVKQIKSIHGDGGWATEKQAWKALGNEKKGLNVCSGFLWNGEGHMLTVSMARSGKGLYIIAPALTHNLLSAKDAPSFVVLDPKGENINISGDYLKRAGYNVYCINPFDIPEISRFGKAGYNPLEFDPDPDIANDHIDSIVNAIVPESQHKSKFFDDTARDIIRNYIKHLITQDNEPKTFNTLYRWILFEGQMRNNLWLDMSANTAFDGIISDFALSIAGQASSGGAGQNDSFSTARTHMSAFSNQKINQFLSNSDFNVKYISKEKNAVFICIPEKHLKTYQSLIRMLFGSILSEIKSNYYPERRIILLMDEFAQLGYFKEAADFMSYGAHYATLWPIIHDLTQLRGIYPNEWESIVNNSHIIHWMKINDNFTRDYVSKRMPIETRIIGSEADGTPKYSKKPLLTPYEVGNHPHIIMQVSNLGNPVNVKKAAYFEQNNNGKNLRS